MSSARERGYITGAGLNEGMRFIRFLPSTDNYKALRRLPALVFQEYTHDPDRMYERGEVFRMPGDEVSKYLLQGDGPIQEPPRIENNQVQPSLLKLFRDNRPAPWVREEFCEYGLWRWWENPQRPEENGWYMVAVPWVDDATPPPNAPDRWERIME